MKKRTSAIWQYFRKFEFPNDQRARCELCSATISFTGGSTANLLRHLKGKHHLQKLEDSKEFQVDDSTLQYPQKYRSAWETDLRFKGWLAPVPEEEERAHCKICEINIQAHIKSLTTHASSRKHLDKLLASGDSEIIDNSYRLSAIENDNNEHYTERTAPCSFPSTSINHTLLSITNLNIGISDSDISELFSEFGPTVSSAVHYDKSGIPLGMAHVLYEQYDDAMKAFNKYNGVTLDGEPMNITVTIPSHFAKQAPKKPVKRRLGSKMFKCEEDHNIGKMTIKCEESHDKSPKEKTKRMKKGTGGKKGFHSKVFEPEHPGGQFSTIDNQDYQMTEQYQDDPTENNSNIVISYVVHPDLQATSNVGYNQAHR